MGSLGGLLIAVPIPEVHAADGLIVEEAIGKALAEAEQLGIKGSRVTPFLLERCNRLTSGASLVASKLLMNFLLFLSNIIVYCRLRFCTDRALIEHNAFVGADIAVQLALQLSSSSSTSPTPTVTRAQ